MAKKLVGIRSHGRGWQAYVRIAGASIPKALPWTRP